MTTSEDPTLINIKDPLTVSRLGVLKEELVEHLKVKAPIVINLVDVKTCDTAGIQFLIAVAKTLRQHGLKVAYDGVPDVVIRAAENVGFSFAEFAKAETC